MTPSRPGALPLSALAAFALVFGDTPAPRAAPPARAHQGAALFADPFTAGARPEWRFDTDSVWTVTDGHLRAELPHQKQQRSFAYVGSPEWKDYSVDVDVCGLRGVDKGLAVRVGDERHGVGIDLRAARYNDIVVYRGFELWARAPKANVNGTWYHVRVEVRRNRYRAYVDGDLVVDYTDESNSRPRGRVALAAYTGGVAECLVMYDNVEVRTLE